ncbi:MAG: ABC transporter substrate-binding protein [Dongiaceae bacterium]
MMIARRPLLGILLGCAIGWAAPAGAAGDPATDPGAFVTNLGEKALAEIKKNASSRAQMEANFQQLLEQYFDVPSISRFVLARYWKVATDAEKAEFTKLFERYVVQSYATRFSEYSGETFQVKDIARNQPDAGYDTVRSIIVRPGEENVRAEWVLRSTGGQLRIVDVKIEGISMVQTYRNEFASVIQNGGGKVAALNEALKKKIAQGQAS